MKNKNTPLIETERLILRKFTGSDVPDIFFIYGNREVNKFLPWFPLNTMEEARAYLYSEIFTEYEKDIAYRYAIEYKPTGQVIGYVSVCGIDERSASGDLGYGLLKEFWNKGIMSEAAGAVLTELAENGFKFLTATHDENNPGSGRVMEKIGMVYQHTYIEQWQPKDIPVTFRLYRKDFN